MLGMGTPLKTGIPNVWTKQCHLQRDPQKMGQKSTYFLLWDPQGSIPQIPVSSERCWETESIMFTCGEFPNVSLTSGNMSILSSWVLSVHSASVRPTVWTLSATKKDVAIPPSEWEVQLVPLWKDVTEVGKFSLEPQIRVAMCEWGCFLYDQFSWEPFTSLWYSSWTWSASMSSHSWEKTHLEFTTFFSVKLTVFTTTWNSGDIFFDARLSGWKQWVPSASGARSSLCGPFSMKYSSRKQKHSWAVVRVGSSPQKIMFSCRLLSQW